MFFYPHNGGEDEQGNHIALTWQEPEHCEISGVTATVPAAATVTVVPPELAASTFLRTP